MKYYRAFSGISSQPLFFRAEDGRVEIFTIEGEWRESNYDDEAYLVHLYTPIDEDEFRDGVSIQEITEAEVGT